MALWCTDDRLKESLRGSIIGRCEILSPRKRLSWSQNCITFATSIPAAVIYMAILKAFRDATIQETTSQDHRLAAGTRRDHFVYGPDHDGWWTGFPYG